VEPGLSNLRKTLYWGILPFLIFCLYWKLHAHESVGKLPSILPPLITVYFALLCKDVYLALFFGIFLGSILLSNGLFLTSALDSGVRLISVLVGDPRAFSLAGLNWGNLKIIAFAYLLGGMIALCTANGGMQGLMRVFLKFSKDRVRAQLSTWFMGLMIFFDDYTNCLLVGNTMRPITDRFKISREKLAYIVDSTAAPIATIAPVSTWIGYEIGLIDSSLKNYPALSHWNAFSVFLSSLPYSYYAFFTLFFILLYILWGMDFGPMYEAQTSPQNNGEKRAEVETAQISHWSLALGPVFLVILVTLAMLYKTGIEKLLHKKADLAQTGVGEILSSGDAGTSLLTAAFLGCFLAVALSVITKALSPGGCLSCLVQGGKKMLAPTLVLCLSWALGGICFELKTGAFVSLMVQAHLPVEILPILVFLTSALIAFATGTSWGCMAIMVPMVLGITSLHSPEHLHLFLGSVAGILGGASFGDHCSPISDTTVLSSMATDVNHLDHVKTQIPYAVFVGVFVVLALGVNSILGTGPWPGLLGGFLLLTLSARFLGRKVVQEGEIGGRN